MPGKLNFITHRIAITVVILCLCSDRICLAEKSDKQPSNNVYEMVMKQDLLCLMMAYPEYIVGIEGRNNGAVYLVMKSGKKILYDDKRRKTNEEKANDSDIQDMMEQSYPLQPITKLMDSNFDPGRTRSYDILREVYGGSRQQIEKNLTNVNVGFRNVQFNHKNKAGSSLQAAFKELSILSKARQDIRANLYPCSGTYNYRIIAGTNRLSAHSFGIAIDLASNKKDYWKWASPKQGEERLASYPQEIVNTFEKNNFIWGGKWGHFDIMHFEYRPEIIMKAKYFGAKQDIKSPWYNGVDIEQGSTKEYIKSIDEAVKKAG